MMKSPRYIRPVLVSMLAIFFAGCGQHTAPPQSGLPTVQMKIGSKNYQLEVAADEYSREHGLMERDSMPPEHGMIFVFTQDTTDPFWMHNTRIPLDILFIDSSGKIVSVRQMKPYDENTTSPGGAYRWAIELNAGAAGESGVKAGDMLAMPGAAH